MPRLVLESTAMWPRLAQTLQVVPLAFMVPTLWLPTPAQPTTVPRIPMEDTFRQREINLVQLLPTASMEQPPMEIPLMAPTSQLHRLPPTTLSMHLVMPTLLQLKQLSPT